MSSMSQASPPLHPSVERERLQAPPLELAPMTPALRNSVQPVTLMPKLVCANGHQFTGTFGN